MARASKRVCSVQVKMVIVSQHRNMFLYSLGSSVGHTTLVSIQCIWKIYTSVGLNYICIVSLCMLNTMQTYLATLHHRSIETMTSVSILFLANHLFLVDSGDYIEYW